ncbi:MAG: hypothetical protein ACI85F_001328 [Bacteroidia bacterium]|jgi:hypothetical protein
MGTKPDIRFDFRGFEKIEDILFLDEPILTHLTRFGKHYFQYLVETKEGSDIFLIIEVLEQEIHQYLTHRVSLHQLITEHTGFLYLIEQDFEGVVIGQDIILAHLLSEDYLPAVDSFLDYEPSKDSYYFSFIEEFESKAYLHLLREDAFYMKFAPTNGKYSTTIGLSELANELLSNLTVSYANFLKADFFQSFKTIQTDVGKLKKAFKSLEPYLDYRMVDLNYSSFEVGLAVDKVMKGTIQDKRFRKWAEDVGYRYKDLVLGEDYSDSTVEEIVSTYDEEDRRKIFEPIFKITQSPNYSLQIKNNKKNSYKTVRPRKSSVIPKIIPPKKDVIKDDDSGFEIIQVTAVRKKDSNSTTIKLGSNTLFDSYESTEHILTKKEFQKFGYQVDDTISVPVQITVRKDQIDLSASYDSVDFAKTIDSVNIEDATKKIASAIYEYIVNNRD